MAIYGFNPDPATGRSEPTSEGALARKAVLDAGGTPEEAMAAYDAVVYRVNPISDPSRSKIFTSDYKAYQSFIASGGLEANATFIGNLDTGERFSSTAEYEAWQRAQGYVESVDPPLVCPPGMVDNGYGKCVVAHGLLGPEGGTPPGPTDPSKPAAAPGDWDTNKDTGAFEDWFVDTDPEVVSDPGIPTLTEAELVQARNLLEAELRMSGFDSAAIGRLLDNWIIPRLTGTFFHEETGVTMLPPDEAIDLLPELYQQQEFKDRFPGYHPRLDAGYNAIGIQDYLKYEDHFHELMVQYGLDILIEDSGVSSREYIGNLITSNVSLTQLDARITQGVSAVLDAPPEVLDQYEEWYGAEGENALLATYLDPTRDLIDLADKAGTAIAGGYAKRVLGEQIDLDTAQEIADLDYTNSQLFSAYSALAQQTSLFAERAGEVDFDISEEGVDYALNLDADVVKRVQQRRERRAGDFSGGGGALVSTQGMGFGAVNA
jgi:hypothetical protein